jgi:hypothetical protein
MTEKEPEARDYSWYQTVARCCICGGELAYIGGLGIHPPDPKDPKRLTCMERT